MVKVGIVGGTGYTGVELLRLLVQHPEVELRAITSRKEAGTAVAAMFPGLRRHVGLTFTDASAQTLKGCDVVFFATPNGVAMGEARAVLDAGARIIDLSADFRIREVAEWERWYKVKHGAPELVREAVYGLCEVNREHLSGARLVANPGCYPTATQLALLPLVEAGVVDLDHLIADAKSGVSGAGRKHELPLGFSEAADNFAAYNVPGHRHWPEIRQGLARAAGREVGLVFTAHLLPLIRGIEVTAYARITREADFQQLFEKRYAREPFVDVMPTGSHPDTRSVRAANLCRIAVHRPPQSARGSDTLVVLSVIDNLVKGASGQAVQNMNLMFGLPETAGLTQVAVVPGRAGPRRCAAASALPRRVSKFTVRCRGIGAGSASRCCLAFLPPRRPGFTTPAGASPASIAASSRWSSVASVASWTPRARSSSGCAPSPMPPTAGSPSSVPRSRSSLSKSVPSSRTMRACARNWAHSRRW